MFSLGTLGLIGGIFSLFGLGEEYSAREEQLRLQQYNLMIDNIKTKIKASQEAIHQDELLKESLSSLLTTSVVQNTSPSSFSPLTIDTIGKFNEDRRLLKQNLDIAESGLSFQQGLLKEAEDRLSLNYLLKGLFTGWNIYQNYYFLNNIEKFNRLYNV